jgi:hypothetical protein
MLKKMIHNLIRSVIPAEAGIQDLSKWQGLDSGLRRNDGRPRKLEMINF